MLKKKDKSIKPVSIPQGGVVAIFSSCGLGDGLISCVVAHNLAQNGYQVHVFHPFLKELQLWFPSLHLQEFTCQPKEFETYSSFDHVFFFYEKSSRMDSLQTYCIENLLEKTTLFNPIATHRCDYPYWDHGGFNGCMPLVDNLYQFCKRVLHFPVPSKSNGIIIPSFVHPQRFKRRVIIHPTSSKEEKNWAAHKFLLLSDRLIELGLEPVFVVSQKEQKNWPQAKVFPSLSELASFVCESGYFIGNDSGIGHLASCLGIPTVTICRTQRGSLFWRPAWAPGKVIYPSSLIPNLKGTRWRDRYWKELISVRSVFKSFIELYQVNPKLKFGNG